jgi:outer membrane protein TolC
MAACQSYSSDSNNRIMAAQATIPPVWNTVIDVPATSEWSDVFNDAQLQTYLNTAQSQNFTLKLAETQYARAMAAVARAESGLAPRATYSGGAGINAPLDDIGDASEALNLGLSGSFDPDLFGLNKANVAQAEAARIAALADLETTRQNVNASVVRAYYAAIEADLLLNLAERNLDFQKATFNIAKIRFENGATARDSFVLAESELQTALGSLELQAATARDTRRALSELLGNFPDAALLTGDSLDIPLTLPDRRLPASMLASLPEIRANAADIEAAYISQWRTARENWPGITLSGSLRGNTDDIGDLFDPASFVASLASSLFGTLFDGGLNAANRADAEAVLNAAILRYGQSLRAATLDIESAYDRAAALQQALVYSQAASVAANEALQIERIKYEAGDSQLLDVLTIQRRVNSIDAALIRTKGDLIDITVEAFRVTGVALNDAI